MMAGRGSSTGDAAGGPARHIPVLRDRVVELLAPRPGGIYVDGTFGAGGYAGALLESGCRVLAIDRDPAAVTAGQSMVDDADGRLELVEGRFSELDRIADRAGLAPVDGVALDVGVSSMQLDEAERGFSFAQEGPLDMRMGGDGPTAADVVNTMDEADLARVIFVLGEERRSRAVARALVRQRRTAPFATTRALADAVERTVGRARDGIHPATRTFQALRIYVNSELQELAHGLGAAERVLKPSGRLAVVSFHSLEDRIVKRFLSERSGGRGTSRHLPEIAAEQPTFRLLSRRALRPDESECAANPRARSARLRAGERTEAPARPVDEQALGVPRLPSLETLARRLQ